MRILIIEDEQLAAEKMQNLLKEIKEDYKILAVLKSVEDSIKWLQDNDGPDLILSDIHLSDGICFSIFSEYEVQCPVIFTTAYEKYAIQAFEVNSIDYLLKPIQKEKLKEALDKYELLSGQNEKGKMDLYEEFKNILSGQNREFKTRFLCKLGNKIKSVPVDSISYFYSENKMTFIVDKKNNRLPINNTLDEIDQIIDPKNFFRVNRKYVSHFEAISEIHPYFKGRLKLILQPGEAKDIIVSSERAPLFKAWLDK